MNDIRNIIFQTYKNNSIALFLKKYSYFNYLTIQYDLDIDTSFYKNLVQHLQNDNYYEFLLKDLRNESIRFKRLSKRLVDMFNSSGSLYFLTFTIDQKNYLKYDNRKFSNYIYEFLKVCPFVKCYVYNLDLSQSERLHAHAFVLFDSDKLDYNYIQSLYRIGNLDFERSYNSNYSAISYYILKLTNHSFKDRTFKVHYSRKKKMCV